MIGRDWNGRRDKKRRVLSMSFTRLSIISSSIAHRRAAEQLHVDREIETSFVDLSSTRDESTRWNPLPWRRAEFYITDIRIEIR